MPIPDVPIVNPAPSPVAESVAPSATTITLSVNLSSVEVIDVTPPFTVRLPPIVTSLAVLIVVK